MIVLGRVVAPFGIHGWVRIQPFGDDPADWRNMSQWWLGTNPDSQAPGDWHGYELRDLRPQGKGIVVALRGIEDRTAAEALNGLYVAAPREDLPVTGKDEYYWADLIGLAVLGTGGIQLGRVKGLLDTGVHAVLQVEDGDQERLIPFVGAYVQNVNLESGEIQVEWEADW